MYFLSMLRAFSEDPEASEAVDTRSLVLVLPSFAICDVCCDSGWSARSVRWWIKCRPSAQFYCLFKGTIVASFCLKEKETLGFNLSTAFVQLHLSVSDCFVASSVFNFSLFSLYQDCATVYYPKYCNDNPV